jgi:hypothetical protein
MARHRVTSSVVAAREMTALPIKIRMLAVIVALIAMVSDIPYADPIAGRKIIADQHTNPNSIESEKSHPQHPASH